MRRFEETGCLKNRPHNGAARLSEVRTSSVVSQMNTLRKQSTSGVPEPLYIGQISRNTGIARVCITVLHPSRRVTTVPLQIAITSTSVAR